MTKSEWAENHVSKCREYGGVKSEFSRGRKERMREERVSALRRDPMQRARQKVSQGRRQQVGL